jgi:hypothetical protein
VSRGPTEGSNVIPVAPKIYNFTSLASPPSALSLPLPCSIIIIIIIIIIIAVVRMSINLQVYWNWQVFVITYFIN